MSRRVDVAEWIGRREFERADPFTRRAYVDFCAGRLKEAKRRQIIQGIGADGRPMPRVQPDSRPDGTRDRPLIPHDDASRTLRLLKLTPNANTGFVTFHWLGWTTILGYHAAGAGHLPVRDVYGTPGRFLRQPKAEARSWWAEHVPSRSFSAPPAAMVARPRAGGPPRFFL